MRTATLLTTIAIAGLAIAWQGWRTRGPDADVVASMVRTVAFVERGHLPQRGNLTDHNSFRPPGLSWLLLPGVIAFDDPRRVELAASACLYLLTLLGVFVLGRELFDPRVALIASIAYACSGIAIYLASTMQPKAYPLFGVWMVYCCARWIRGRDARWFAAACVVCAAGAYVHLEMMVMAPVLPLLWLITRAPITGAAGVGAAVAIVVMWSPFLIFESTRGFVDLESQLLLRRLDVRGPEVVTWCGEEPTQNPQFVTSERDNLGTRARIASIADQALMNFQTRVPAGSIVLFALFVGGMLIAARGSPGQIALAVATGVPMLVLIVLTEPGVPRQLMLWPMQLLLVVRALMTGLDMWRASTLTRGIAAAVIVAIVALNGQVLTRARAMAAGGWSGAEPEQIEAAEFRTVRCSDEP